MRGGCWKRGGNFFRGRGAAVLQKNKLKSEMFHDKKKIINILKNIIKIFFSVITKISNWEILTKNLVTFKR